MHAYHANRLEVTSHVDEAVHAQITSRIESLREGNDLLVIATTSKPTSQLLCHSTSQRDVVRAVACDHSGGVVTRLQQRPELLAGEVAEKRTLWRWCIGE